MSCLQAVCAVCPRFPALWDTTYAEAGFHDAAVFEWFSAPVSNSNKTVVHQVGLWWYTYFGLLWVPCWVEQTCVLHLPRKCFVTWYLQPVLSPNNACPFKSLLLTFASSCFICGPLILTICVKTHLESVGAWRAHSWVYNWRQWLWCFRPGIYTTPVRFMDCHRSSIRKMSEKMGNAIFREEQIMNTIL